MSALSGGTGRPVDDVKAAIVATVVSVAESVGVRTLRGGGAVFAHHGLISPGDSPFVSFIVEPSRVTTLARGLQRVGFTITPPVRSRALPDAIVRLERPDSPPVHVHGVIPGFFADPAETFAALWSERGVMPSPAGEVAVLGRSATVLFAIHSRLDGIGSATRYRDFFRVQFVHALRSRDRSDVAALLARVGAGFELRPLHDVLEVEIPAVPPSPGYVSARLGLETALPEDIWLVDRLEGAGLTPWPGALSALRAWRRMRLAAPAGRRS